MPTNETETETETETFTEYELELGMISFMQVFGDRKPDGKLIFNDVEMDDFPDQLWINGCVFACEGSEPQEDNEDGNTSELADYALLGIGAVGVCAKHGEYKMDAMDSPCPSCEDDDEDEEHPDAESHTDDRVIKAEVHEDQHRIESNFDAEDWFKQADDSEIEDLHSESWQFGYAADGVARFYEAQNADVAAVFNLINSINHKRCETGFGCSIDGDDAMAWLKENRLELAQKLFDKDCEEQAQQLIRDQKNGLYGGEVDDAN